MNDVYKSLAEKLDSLPNGFPPTERGIELRILKKIFTPDEAEMALKLNPMPEMAEAIADRLEMPLEKLEPILDNMVRRGEIGSAAMKGKQLYMLVPFVVGIFEFQLDRMDKELADMIEDYAPELMDTLGRHEPAVMRVIPANIQIDAEHQVHLYEDLRKVIDKAKSFQLMECICRKERALQGKPCKTTTEVCLGFANHEGAFDKFPKGKIVSREDALKVLERSEEEGLVHSTYNVQKGLMFVCNCCSCCCGILRGMKEFNAPHLMAKSNYVALIDQDECIACGVCAEERCPMEAIVEDNGSYRVQPERCIGCGVCSTGCPNESISMIRKPEDEQDQPPTNIMEWYFKRAANRGVPITVN
jgi:H+/Na+-translocating ferredoxin:NAD+ oxidoreductase subunit B